jgi:hypothetical protein
VGSPFGTYKFDLIQNGDDGGGGHLKRRNVHPNSQS